MSTLLLRLAAPMQSWGSDAKFERRGTERIPTKSGVIGMLAASLGRKRNESITDLLQLRFGVRVDREGMLLRDYHTAKREKVAYVTHRYYLADAVFLVGLEGENSLLERIEIALRYPAFALFLGRRSCPPEGRLSLGIRTNKCLLEALGEEPSLILARGGADQITTHLRVVADAEADDTQAYLIKDMPLSFNPIHRKYGFRRVSESSILSVSPRTQERKIQTEVTFHDPFAEMEE